MGVAEGAARELNMEAAAAAAPGGNIGGTPWGKLPGCGGPWW